MIVGVIIAVMIAIVVGVSLIPMIVETINTLPAEATEGPVGGLLNVIPYILVAVIILGAVAWIGGGMGDDKKKIGGKEARVKIEKNGKKLILLLTTASKSIGEYINNLDAILGVKTINDNSGTSALHPLVLHDKDLHINTYSYDWYLVDKHPDMVMFKIVGLHKTDASKNAVYVVGSNDGEPYLFQVPNEYIEEQSQRWIEVALTKV